MKKIVLLLAVVITGMSSCKKSCESGYEGSNCTTEIRAKYYGTYSGNSVTNGNNLAVDCIIGGGSSGIHSLIVQGGLTSGIALQATLANNNDGSFVINTQVINSSITVSGSGQFVGNNVTLNIDYASAFTTSFSGTRP